MPQAVVAVKAFMALSAAAKLAAIGTFILKTALVAAVSYGLARLVAKKPGAARSAALVQGSVLDMTIEPDTARRVVYGELRVGGSVRLKHIAGSSNQYLYIVLVLAGHQCEAIGDIYFADEIVPLDESGNATGTYAGVCRITKHLGAADQAADSNFVAELGDVWTSDHRLRGCAYLAIRLTWDQDKFPGGMPVVTAVVKGKNNIYDTRTATTGWSDNPSLCIRDYLLDQKIGMQGTTDDLIESSFITAANDCDTMVALAGGGEEKLYTLNGAFDTSVVPAQVIEAMCDAMAGDIYDVGGQAYVTAGVWHTPDFDLTATALRGGMTTTSPLSLREKFNGAKGTFNDPAELWNRTDFPAYAPAGLLAEDNGRERMADLDLPFVNSASRCQRIAKIAVLLTRHGTLASIPCNLRGIPAMPGKNIRVTNAKRSWTNKHFKVREFTLSTDRGSDGGLGFVVDVVAQSTASSIYDWDSTGEVPYSPAPGMGIYDPRTVPTPTGLALATLYHDQPDGTYVPRLRATWNLPADTFVLNGGATLVEYKLTEAEDWTAAPAIAGDSTTYIILDVEAGQSYDVRVAHQNSHGVRGAWSAPVTATVALAGAAPNAPTSLTVEPMIEGLVIKWVNPTNVPITRIYIHEAATGDEMPAAASFAAPWPAQSFFRSDLAEGTTRHYWLVAEGRNGRLSTPAGPVSATVPTWPVVDGLKADMEAIARTQARLFAAHGEHAAAIEREEITRLEADLAEVSARESAIAALQAVVDGKATIAALNEEILLSATRDAALARTLSQLFAVLGDHSGSITREEQVRITETGSLMAEYVLNIVTSGGGVPRVTGFRLTNLGGAGGGSEMVFQADKIAMVNETGHNLKAPFALVDGVVWMNMAMIKTASITSAMIENLAANKVNAADLSAITAFLGNMTFGATGHLRSAGATAFGTGVGIWMGYDDGVWKFRVGDPAGNRISWDGSAWTVVGFPTGAVADDAALSTPSSNTIRVSKPGGMPSGYMVFYRQGGGALADASSFPFDIAMASGTEELRIWASAPGYTQSAPIITSYNILTV